MNWSDIGVQSYVGN